MGTREELNEAGRKMFDGFRGMGLSESSAFGAVTRNGREAHWLAEAPAAADGFDQLVAAFRSTGASEESARQMAIGRDLTESAARRRFGGPVVQLSESATSARLVESGRVKLRLISPGQGSSGHYSAAVLEQAARDRVFPAGTQMYWDHPVVGERPERSLRDLAGVLENDAQWQAAGPDGPGLYATASLFGDFGPRLKEMAGHIGVSIRATGEAAFQSGQKVIERLVACDSVDFVTRAGRGGAVLQVL